MGDNWKKKTGGIYWYLHTNGKLIKKRSGFVNISDLNESDFVVKWWYIEKGEDMLIMLSGIKNHFSAEAFNKFRNRAEHEWGITSADYFKHAVKVAAEEGL